MTPKVRAVPDGRRPEQYSGSTVLRGEAVGPRKHYKRIIVTTRAKAIGTAAVLLLAMVGCAPGTPDEDSWRADATRAVGDVASAVQTAQLALAQSEAGHLSHAYLQSVLVDAERTGGMAAQTLSSVQPPDGERERSSDVLDTLNMIRKIGVPELEDQLVSTVEAELEKNVSKPQFGEVGERP